MSDIPDDAPLPDEAPPAPDSPPPPSGGGDIPTEALDPSGRSADELPRTAPTPGNAEPYPRSQTA